MSDPNNPYRDGAYTDPRLTPDLTTDPYATRDYADAFPTTPTRRGAELEPVQPIGMLQSATIKSLIAGLVIVLAAFGVKVGWSDADVDKVADAVIALATVGSTVAGIVFRIRAERKVVPGATATDTKSSNVTSACFALFASIAVYAAAGGAVGGCAAMFPASATPISRVYAIKYAWTQTQIEAKRAIDARMFDARPDVLRAIPPARQAVDDAIATALRFAQDPARKTDAVFWIEAADKALQRFIELTGPANRAIPATNPTTRPASATFPMPERDTGDPPRLAA